MISVEIQEVLPSMSTSQPQPIHLAQADAWQKILPRSPVLSSHSVHWQGIHLEYHRQPAHETPDYCFPSHLLSIGLGYQAKEFKANRKTYKNFVVGNVAICPAHQSLKTQAYGNAEFLLLAIDVTFFDNAAYESVDGKSIELMQQVVGHDPLIYQMALVLKRELESRGDDSRLYAESIVTALSFHLIRHYTAQAPLMKSYKGGLPYLMLREILNYIQEHLSEDLSLVELATVAHMSPHYFSTLFKQSTGISPRQYITQCRIEIAKQLLTRRDLTIVEICHQVGFQSQSHFTNIFHRHTKVTPKTYRNLL
jgi:AraC family transcriptional regulator